MAIVSDGLRKADEDNLHGYLEFEPVKNLVKDSAWLFEHQGKAIKIVAPLLMALPPDLPLCPTSLAYVESSGSVPSVRKVGGERGSSPGLLSSSRTRTDDAECKMSPYGRLFLSS
jgi:hypothetical protein